MPSQGRYEPTSERVDADFARANEGDYLVYMCHLATYDHVVSLVAGRKVLDYGCGTGYGARRLAPAAASVVGVDVSADAVSHAAEAYRAANLRFQAIDPAGPLPFPDGEFEVVLSFQVVEHVPDADRYLAEIARVLAPGGVLALATPDRTTRLFRGQRPWNRFHLTEYDAPGLERLLRHHFADVDLQYMGGEPAVLAQELRRCRRLRWTTLPFTFPGAPERWRLAGLTALKRLQTSVRARGGESPAAGTGPDGALQGGAGDVVGGSGAYRYDQTALRIGPAEKPSVNLVAVCREATRQGSRRGDPT